jgi:hypothetical protein
VRHHACVNLTVQAVPSSIHCDHLIEAETGAAQDLESAKITNKVGASSSSLDPPPRGAITLNPPAADCLVCVRVRTSSSNAAVAGSV